MLSEIDLSQFEGSIITADQAESDDRLKLLILGGPKSGKSCTAVTGPLINPKNSSQRGLFVWDFDDRKESILQFLRSSSGLSTRLPQTYIRTLTDNDSDNPSAFRTFETDLSMFEYKVEQQKKDPSIITPATYVFDSLTYFGEYLINAFCKEQTSGSNTYIKLKLGTKTVNIPRGFDSWRAETGMLNQILHRLFALGNVIVIGHIGAEKDKAASSKDNAVYTNKISINPPRYSSLIPAFNEVWRVKFEDDKFRLQCKQSNDFDGATCLSIDSEEPPNIEDILKKHRSRKQ